MPGRLGKRDAISRMNREYGAAVLQFPTTHFANINAAKDVWWFDIPIDKTVPAAGEKLDLLVYDFRKDQLYHLRVPTEYFRQHMKDFSKRDDKDTISLWLSSEGTNLFRDLRSTNGGVPFAQFLLKESIGREPVTHARESRETSSPRGNNRSRALRSTGDDLMKWHRELLRLLDSLDARRDPGAGPAARIRRLRESQVVAPKIAAFMLSITEALTAAVNQGDEPSPAEGAAVQHAWLAISEWAQQRGAQMV